MTSIRVEATVSKLYIPHAIGGVVLAFDILSRDCRPRESAMLV